MLYGKHRTYLAWATEDRIAKVCVLCCLLRAKVLMPSPLLCCWGSQKWWREMEEMPEMWPCPEGQDEVCQLEPGFMRYASSDNRRWDYTTPKTPMHYWDACYHQVGERTTFSAQLILPPSSHLIRLVTFHQVTRKRRFSVSRGTS